MSPGRPWIVVVGFPSHPMTSRLRDELLARGHRAEVVHPDDLVTEVETGCTVVHPFGAGPRPDAVLLTVSTDHLPAVSSVAELERTGTPVTNRPSAVLAAADKSRTAVLLTVAGVPVPRTVCVTTVESARDPAERLGYPLVVKAADGAEGAQVRRVLDPGGLAEAIDTVRTSSGHGVSARTPVLVQELLTASVGHDRRIFVVGGVAQAAMDRVARAGEWRSNLSLGAAPVAAVATEQEAHVAVRAAAALGLDFGCVDIMWDDDGPLVVEANPYGDALDVAMTSGIDLISAVADLVEMRAGVRPTGGVQPRPLAESARRELTDFCLRRLAAKALELGQT